MRIGKYNYKIILRVEKIYIKKELYKAIRKLLIDHNKYFFSYKFSVNGNSFICDSLKDIVYYQEEGLEGFEEKLIKLGNEFGIYGFSFPPHYYHK